MTQEELIWECEWRQMMLGVWGQSYSDVLIGQAAIEAAGGPYVPLENTDSALAAISPTPEPPKQSGWEQYRAELERLFRQQFSGEELDGLLKTLNEAS